MRKISVPQEVIEELNEERKFHAGKSHICSNYVVLYNNTGTRYFRAVVHRDWDGNVMYWEVRYGEYAITSFTDRTGVRRYILDFGKHYARSLNGTIIPEKVNTRDEALELARRIGNFAI